jgi:hypothetical protein
MGPFPAFFFGMPFKTVTFWPSVGPGYDDTRVRPWNSGNRKHRENGAYFTRVFNRALAAVREKNDENGSKSTENGSKSTENGSKTPENGSKSAENVSNSAENGSKWPKMGGITITSWNEHHEGSGIEPCVPKSPEMGPQTPENGQKRPENAEKRRKMAENRRKMAENDGRGLMSYMDYGENEYFYVDLTRKLLVEGGFLNK